MEIDISARARRHIRAHGGCLSVWFQDFGGSWMVQKASTRRPEGDLAFDEYEEGDLTICLQSDYAPPPLLRVRLHPWWPRQPIAVSVPDWHGDEGSTHGWDQPKVARYGHWPSVGHHHGGHGGGGGGGHHGGGHGGGNGGGNGS